MIKFFRKIRQKLLSENKFNKYLLYAMGEIILVVIGILIALQINNWNELKSERVIENTYMKNLLEDLEDDLVIYDKFQDSNQEVYMLIDSIIPGLKSENRKNNVGKLAYWSRMVTIKWTIIHPVKRTYEQMKSSGHLRLVSNNEVSNSISKYYNSLSEFDGYNEAGMLWAADYVESLGKIFDAEIMLNIMRTRQMTEANKNDLLTENPIVLNQLMNSLNYFNGALSLAENVSLVKEEDAKKLIDLIKSNYNLNQ
ncbi:MAG TPA: hypothetical protein DCS66_24830 [Flavobacteriaceae bacterium]|nr:hypothetical protein [Flavobacteriaceae bacterium]|tara:strand:+ start:1357 stop:2118 length:762 start_codon:yes stop_codon:yes gene_type:complete